MAPPAKKSCASNKGVNTAIAAREAFVNAPAKQIASIVSHIPRAAGDRAPRHIANTAGVTSRIKLPALP